MTVLDMSVHQTMRVQLEHIKISPVQGLPHLVSSVLQVISVLLPQQLPSFAMAQHLNNFHMLGRKLVKLVLQVLNVRVSTHLQLFVTWVTTLLLVASHVFSARLDLSVLILLKVL